jgi:hypothetical protein
MKTIINIVAVTVAFTIQTTAATIGIDARHGDASSSPAANLATGTNFDDFRATIVAEGHTLVNLNSFTATDLAGIDALIVRQSPRIPGVFGSAEISDIHAFVTAGHGLLVMAEGGFSSDSTVANINSLASPFGITYGASPLHGEGFTVNGFLPHPVTLGVNTIGVDFFRPMVSISAPALDLTLLSGDNDILAAVNGINGRGNVVLLSDISLWVDADVQSDRTITFGDNRLLLQNTISFVAVPEPSIFLLAVVGGLMVWAFYRRRTRHA